MTYCLQEWITTHSSIAQSNVVVAARLVAMCSQFCFAWFCKPPEYPPYAARPQPHTPPVDSEFRTSGAHKIEHADIGGTGGSCQGEAHGCAHMVPCGPVQTLGSCSEAIHGRGDVERSTVRQGGQRCSSAHRSLDRTKSRALQESMQHGLKGWLRLSGKRIGSWGWLWDATTYSRVDASVTSTVHVAICLRTLEAGWLNWQNRSFRDAWPWLVG